MESFFYKNRDAYTRPSAEAVISHFVQQDWSFKAVADFGCGVGTWLSVCRKYGADTVRGIEETADPKPFLEIKEDEFEVGDVVEGLSDFQADLALCLEVAEHLPPDRSKDLVRRLVGAAPVVLFSAAVPGQVGYGHINCNWQSYWASLFAAYGYMPSAALRASIWSDKDIHYWYRQNLLVYQKVDQAESKFEAGLSIEGMPLDVVHPEMFESIDKQLQSVRQKKLSLKQALKHSVCKLFRVKTTSE